MIPADTRLRILERHADPRDGAPYWIDFFRRRGLTPREVAADPLAAGVMDVAALRTRPLEDFVPRAVLAAGTRLITSETSGITGQPIQTVFTEAEFHAAFVAPFLARAAAVGFPVCARWLWAGPSGPHAIGKAVRAILAAVGGMDPFSVDFDPRWFRRLPEDSVSRARYMAHVEEQIRHILDTQRVDVIFSTPPVIRRLLATLPAERRAAIRGVHYGGMAIPADEYAVLRAGFPNAVHLHGYGNSLCGVFLEADCGPAGIEYDTASDRVEVDVVREGEGGRLYLAEEGTRGRVLLSRYDASFLILNQLERDVAVRLPGRIRDPMPADARQLRQTLY